MNTRQRLAHQIAAFEERAAIAEYDGVQDRAVAERIAEAECGRPTWSGSIVKVIDAGKIDPL